MLSLLQPIQNLVEHSSVVLLKLLPNWCSCRPNPLRSLVSPCTLVRCSQRQWTPHPMPLLPCLEIMLPQRTSSAGVPSQSAALLHCSCAAPPTDAVVVAPCSMPLFAHSCLRHSSLIFFCFSNEVMNASHLAQQSSSSAIASTLPLV